MRILCVPSQLTSIPAYSQEILLAECVPFRYQHPGSPLLCIDAQDFQLRTQQPLGCLHL